MNTLSLDAPFQENIGELVNTFAQSTSMQAHLGSFDNADTTPEAVSERAESAYQRIVDIVDFDGATIGEFIDTLKTDEAQNAITAATSSDSTVRTLNNHVFATLENDLVEPA